MTAQRIVLGPVDESCRLITKKTSVTLRTVHKRLLKEKLSLTIIKSDDDYRIRSKENVI